MSDLTLSYVVKVLLSFVGWTDELGRTAEAVRCDYGSTRWSAREAIILKAEAFRSGVLQSMSPLGKNDEGKALKAFMETAEKRVLDLENEVLQLAGNRHDYFPDTEKRSPYLRN